MTFRLKHKGRPIWQFYCPYCSVTRRLPFQARPDTPVQLARMALATAFVTLVLWEWFGIKGALSAFPIWAAFEIAYRLRVRAALACTTCGFDPYLYKSNLPRARAEIEAKWREKFEERGIPFPEKSDSLRRPNPVETSQPES